MPEEIRWVVFDCVGTLITPHPAAHEVYALVASRHGSRLTTGEIYGRFRESLKLMGEADRQRTVASDRGPLWICGTTNESRERERWRTVVRSVICDVDHDQCFEELFDYFGVSRAWKIYDDVAPVLRSIVEAGLGVAIASNFDRRLHAILDDAPEFAVMKHRFISSEIGFPKPDYRFYEAVVRSIGAKPAEILFVGDDRRNDVEAPRAAGFRAVHLLRRVTASCTGEKQGGTSLADLSELPGLILGAAK